MDSQVDAECEFDDDLLSFLDDDLPPADSRPVQRGTPTSGRHRAWVFTINNYTDTTLQNLQSLCSATRGGCSYLTYGREIAPSTGTKHLQGYIYWTSACDFLSTKERISRGTSLSPYIAVAKGTPESNQKYCQKTDSADPDFVPHFFEYGTIPSQGKRIDIEQWCEDFASGKRLKTALQDSDYPFVAMCVRYPKGYQKLEEATITHRANSVRDVIWICGGSGMGKSYLARKLCPEVYVYPNVSEEIDWWENYQGEKEVLIEEMNKSTFKWKKVLRILDVYDYTCPIKGSSLPLAATKFIMTSMSDPCEIFNNHNDGEEPFQLYRRITKCYKIEQDPTNDLMRTVHEMELSKDTVSGMYTYSKGKGAFQFECPPALQDIDSINAMFLAAGCKAI